MKPFLDYFKGLLKPSGLISDSYFLKYRLLDQLFTANNMNLAYALSHVIQDEFFWAWEMGDFRKMTRGLSDVRVFFSPADYYLRAFFFI